MAEVVMPRLSDSMTEGTIVRWLKADGDPVRSGEEIVEIETDKATLGYESEFDGTLAIRSPEGATVQVGAVIAVVGNGDAGPALRAGAPRVKASPLARRLARALGVELSSLHGSGPGGRVVKVDVVTAAGPSAGAATGAPAGAPAGAATGAPADAGPGPVSGDDIQELTRTQALIAQRMTQSRSTVPEFALEVDVDMSGALHMRSALKELADPAPSLNDIIVKGCALALRRHPRANGAFAEDRFVLHSHVHVAIAVAVEGSLLTPVVRDADARTVGAIAHETRELIERGRAGRIGPAELEGATFTVSNLGMFGIDRFEGIINAPQAAILCVGAVRDKPVAVDGEVVIRPMATLTLACDHRILYGADAAAFLAEIRQILERPVAMVL
ncbi:MAG: dihydrolipoamide acetyltransferase family protein [Solirubrobacteraceae bacterium]